MLASICIIVPCYNEALRLDARQFLQFASAHPRCHLLMVNDGSRDSTIDVILDLKDRMPHRFDVLDLETNVGKAEAVRQGLLQAIEDRHDYFGFWDADLATPLSAIPEFADILDTRADIDVVIGSRMSLLGRHIQRDFLRQRIGAACSVLASLAIGTRVRDTQCGAKLFRSTPVTRHVFREPLLARWLFDVELFARLIRTWKAVGDRPFSRHVFEFPLQRWDEIPGSSLKKMDFVKAAVELGTIYWRNLGPLASAIDVSEVTKELESRRRLLPLEQRAA